jgi:hypothetical protein
VLQGGLTGDTSSAALTSYVLISLLETGLPVSPSVTANTVFCLKGETESDMYTLVLTTYALTLLGEREMAEESLKRLLGMATRQQDLLWWEKPGMISRGPALCLFDGFQAHCVYIFEVIKCMSQQKLKFP